jgi:hypothetical protein
MKRLPILIAVVLLVVPIAAAEDFTGKWSGAFLSTLPDGSTDNDTIVMTIQQKDAALTGTAGPREDMQWPLKGTVNGNKLTFDVDSNGVIVSFVLTFANGHLKGDANADAPGGKLSAKIDMERSK